LVLDEADRMLDMGFRDDVEQIISHCSKKRQTLLFSATISQEVVNLAKKYMKEQVEVSAKSLVDPKKLEQCYYDIEDGLKYSLLKHLLENEDSKLVMIFCSTRKNVDFVANNLHLMGIDAFPIHGGYSQDKRNTIIKNFHSKNTHVLVATDVAARGLDIKGVSHVYNYDIPNSKDDYIHRIGRTARAGNEGKVINIIASRDYENFRNLISSGFKITLKETPYVKKMFLKWIPERRAPRGNGFGRGGRRYDNRDNRNKGFNNNRNRNSDNRGNRDNRSRSFGNRNRNSDNRNNRGDNRVNKNKNYRGNRDNKNYRDRTIRRSGKRSGIFSKSTLDRR
jgi:ATP-dependent RNA helicase DeaD